jgi:predicted branched-subunit amino acid permease
MKQEDKGPGKQILKDALRDGFALIMGFTPAIMVYAIGAKQIGLSFLETMVLACAVIAATSMIAAVQMISAGADILQIYLATFLINIRFFIFSMAVLPYFKKRTGIHSFILAYPLMTAHVGWVPVKAKEGKSCDDYTLILNCFIIFSTAILTALCYFMMAAIPTYLNRPLAFAVPAAFIAFLVPMVKDNIRRKIIIVSLSGLGTIGFYSLLGNWSFMAIGLAVAYMMAKLEKR